MAGLGPLLGSGFWLLASERFDPRTARRHFGQIAGVGTLAGLAGALVAERVGALYGIAAMLPILAAVSVVCALSIRRFAPPTAPGQTAARVPWTMRRSWRRSHPRSGLRALAKAPYLQNLAALVFLGTLAAAIVDYVFKAAAVESFGRGETLLRFFAIYYAAVSLLAFVVQATVSTLALERLGLGVTASTPSLALVAGGLGGLLLPGLQGALMARAGESVFRGSLFKTGYEIFFTPIQPQDKRAAKSIIDVGFDRLGDAAGGAAVAALLAVPFGDPSQRLLLAAVVCSGAALFAALRLNRGYIQHARTKPVNRAARFRPRGCHRPDHAHVDPQDAAVGRRVGRRGRGRRPGAGDRSGVADRRSRGAGDPRPAIARRWRAFGRCCAKATACRRRSCRMSSRCWPGIRWPTTRSAR